MFIVDDLLAVPLRLAAFVLRRIVTVRHFSAVLSARPEKRGARAAEAEEKTMFLIDDLLGAPMRGLMFVLEKINEAVQNELETEERSIMADLSELHRALEGGTITEAEFDAREQVLLGRLDRLHSEREGDADGDARS